jgi:hypothetical protein
MLYPVELQVQLLIYQAFIDFSPIRKYCLKQPNPRRGANMIDSNASCTNGKSSRNGKPDMSFRCQLGYSNAAAEEKAIRHRVRSDHPGKLFRVYTARLIFSWR